MNNEITAKLLSYVNKHGKDTGDGYKVVELQDKSLLIASGNSLVLRRNGALQTCKANSVELQAIAIELGLIDKPLDAKVAAPTMQEVILQNMSQLTEHDKANCFCVFEPAHMSEVHQLNDKLWLERDKGIGDCNFLLINSVQGNYGTIMAKADFEDFIAHNHAKIVNCENYTFDGNTWHKSELTFAECLSCMMLNPELSCTHHSWPGMYLSMLNGKLVVTNVNREQLDVQMNINELPIADKQWYVTNLSRHEQETCQS